MSIPRTIAIAILVLIVLIANIHAQTATTTTVSSVTGTVTSEGAVRMIAHGEALQVRMEIYSASGELVSDTGLHQGKATSSTGNRPRLRNHSSTVLIL